MTDEEAQKIADRVDAATSGPWFEPDEAHRTGDIWARTEPRSPYTYDQSIIGHVSEVNKNWRHDIYFITQAREDVPALLAERATLRAEVAKLRAILAHAWTDAIKHDSGCGCYTCELVREAITREDAERILWPGE